jgi:MFS family permease
MLLGWSAPTSPQIVENENHEFWVTVEQFAWIVAMTSLGGAFTCIFSGIIRSKVGTKLTIFLFGIPITFGWILLFFSINPTMVSWISLQQIEN